METISEEYVSIFQTPMTEQITLTESWLDKHVGFVGDSWRAKFPEVMCTQVMFKQRKHKRMFDFYAELQGIVVYETLVEYQAAPMQKHQCSVAWMDEE